MTDVVEICPVRVRRAQAGESNQPSEVVPARRQPQSAQTESRKPGAPQPADNNRPGKNSFWAWGNYWRTSPLLIMGIFFYSLLWMLMQHVSPAALANWLFADSYLLVQLLLAGGNYCVLAYLTQSHAWGSWLTLVATSWLFFRLEHFLFTPPLVGSLLVLNAIWWYALIWRPATRIRPENAAKV